MCGIFGIIAKPESSIKKDFLEKATLNIFKLSEMRGRDASGALSVLPDQVEVIKSSEHASYLVAQPQFDHLIAGATNAYESNHNFVVVGHTRMATNGVSQEDNNNHPVIKCGYLILHNGIIVNDDDLWLKNPTLRREYQTDTEIFGALLRVGENRGLTLLEATQEAFSKIKGGNTILTISMERNQIVIATTNGSMYFWHSHNKLATVFASERLIVEQTAKKLNDLGGAVLAQQLKSGYGLAIDLENNKLSLFSLIDAILVPATMYAMKRRLLVQIPIGCVNRIKVPPPPNKIIDIERLMQVDHSAIKQIKRCTKCVLPETFPFIRFDINGVCQICRQYQPLKPKGEDALMKLANQVRKNNGQPDCLVPISGGRDSCYGLHYVKKVLALNPVTFTYDWGLVTDLARRNISRMCGSLGVEHILVAADIRLKRENVRKNIMAWLKSPALGMIPLFMAGDKMFFYYANLIRHQMKLGPILFSMNWLEKTSFKAGFAGINDIENTNISASGKTYGLSFINKIKLMSYYGRQFFTNPAYFNSTILDTLFAFFSYYLQRKNYDSIFDYLLWDENVIVQTILDEYEWETSCDTSSTWRIGDGTAPFYNHIYLSVAGFSEYDTFRSNQIREGLITREEALLLIEEESSPRVESFKWYCDTIGIDAVEALKVIDKIPKLYKN